MNKKIVIYHGYCSDGLAAAWAFHHVMPEAIFHPAIHDGALPPNVENAEVYVLDYAYDRKIMLDIKARAKSLVVLDHHKSAMEQLGDLDFCMFDMNRSGAGMAWDYLFPERHWLINYTEDCDLWNWALPNSREINSAVKSYPITFKTLYDFKNKNLNRIWNRGKWKALINEGAAIRRAELNMVNSIIKKAREVEIQGHKVLMVNSPVLQSDIANVLATSRPFGIAWFENKTDERIYSLRSCNGGIDVSKIAEKYPGGGGHARAAGFRLAAGINL
jgi:oligoribonuclease NrnB/cAMP/cGMP phosphodiesterase (DHH superfamily)